MTNRNHPNPNQRKKQQQNPPRLEFGNEIDVNEVKEQSKRNTKQINVTLDPRDNRL